MFVYADHAATTKLSKAALQAMLPYLQEEYGNPSGLYFLGQRAAEGLERPAAISRGAWAAAARSSFLLPAEVKQIIRR